MPAGESPARLDQRYNDMLRSVADWVWETDTEGTLTYISPPIAACLGIPAQLLIGRTIEQLLGSDERPDAANDMAAAMDARRPFRNEQLELGSAETVSARYRVTGVPYYDDATGAFAGYRGTGTEIPDPSDPARSESGTAGQLLDMLESALARKDQLEWELSKADDGSFGRRLASLAHELRTPLNAIIGFAEVIHKRRLGDQPERYADYAGNIHESSLHLLEIINGLLDQSRLDAEAAPADAEVLDVTEVVTSVLRMLEDEARESDVLLVNDVAADAPDAQADRRAVRQILINLLGNAIKYTPAGGAAGIESRVEDDRMLTLVVWDTGVGIAPENQEKVFQRSYRIAETGLERPGSGLGLSISRDLARSMGGDIKVVSRLGEGSRLLLRLPLASAPRSSSVSGS